MSKSLGALIVIPVIFAFTIIWQAVLNRTFAYQCANCATIFNISPITGALAPHRMGQKLLKCPNCGARTWAKPVHRKE